MIIILGVLGFFVAWFVVGGAVHNLQSQIYQLEGRLNEMAFYLSKSQERIKNLEKEIFDLKYSLNKEKNKGRLDLF